MTKNTGGSAFPREDYQLDSNLGQSGMTLLDYFAAHADISGDLVEGEGTLSQSFATKLMKDKAMPSWTDDYEGALMWWYEAEARLRYIKAKSMLLARENI